MNLIEGRLMPDSELESDHALREEIRDLRDRLRDAQRELSAAQHESARALGNLRRQLGPLYQALQMVFGELDAAGVNEAPAASAQVNSRTSAVWENWKTKLPGRPAQIIDALLLHGEMNSTQIAIAIGIHRNNVPGLIFRLNKAGLIDKNGTKYSLKKL